MYLEHSFPINKNIIFAESNLFWSFLSGIFDVTGFISFKKNSLKFIQFMIPLYHMELINEILLNLNIGSTEINQKYFIIKIYSINDINIFLTNIYPFIRNNTLKSEILKIININKNDYTFIDTSSSLINTIKFFGTLHCFQLFNVNDILNFDLIIKHKDIGLISFIQEYLADILHCNIYKYKHNGFYIIQIKSKKTLLILYQSFINIINDLNFGLINLLIFLKMYILFDIYFLKVKNIPKIYEQIFKKLIFFFSLNRLPIILLEDIVDDEVYVYDLLYEKNLKEMPKEFAHLV